MSKSTDLKVSREVDEKRKFRGGINPRNGQRIERDKTHAYRWVTTDIGYCQAQDEYERVEDAIDRGWQVVYSQERQGDERSFVPDNDKENSERLKPVTRRVRGGYNQVYMKIALDKLAENEAADEAKRKADHHRSVKFVKQSGSDIKVTEQDIQLND